MTTFSSKHPEGYSSEDLAKDESGRKVCESCGQSLRQLRVDDGGTTIAYHGNERDGLTIVCPKA